MLKPTEQTMFDFIRRLFGQGRVRVEFNYLEGSSIRTSSARVPYVGQWDEQACLDYARNQLIVEHGIYPIKMKVASHIEE
jgi:hypothetical protein